MVAPQSDGFVCDRKEPSMEPKDAEQALGKINAAPAST
jgi:hypothetical protein